MIKAITLTFLMLVGLGLTTFAQGADSLTLRVGQQKTAPRADLRIKFIEVVEDSRCPTDVNCVWAGNAKVKLLVSDRRNRTPAKTIVLNTNIGPQSPQSDRFYVYSISLVSLTPEPKKSGGVKRSRYRLVLKITRLSR